MTPTEILKEARRLIAEKGWTQGSFARHSNGDPIGPLGDNAACYCALGAIRKTGNGPEQVFAVFALADVVGDYVSDWNDDPARTKEEVLAAFDEAIRRAEECQ